MTRAAIFLAGCALCAVACGCAKPPARAEIPRGGVVTYSKHLMALDGDTLWTTVAVTSSGGMRVYALEDTLRVFTDDEMWRAQEVR